METSTNVKGMNPDEDKDKAKGYMEKFMGYTGELNDAEKVFMTMAKESRGDND